MGKVKRGRIAKYPCYALKFLEGMNQSEFFAFYADLQFIPNDGRTVEVVAKKTFDEAHRFMFKEHAEIVQAELLVIHSMRTEIVHRHSSKRGKFTLPKYPVKE